MNGRFVAAMLFALGASSALRGDGGFERGHVFVAVSEPESCDFGGREWIVEVDPDTGAWSVFADSDDGLCVVSGLRFTPDGTRLLAANAGHLLKSFDGGWIRAFKPDGTSDMILNEDNGLRRPFGTNCLAFNGAGDLYVLNSLSHTILRFPQTRPPATIFADRFDGVYDRGPIDFAPTGDLFYSSPLTPAMLHMKPDGVAAFFDNYGPEALTIDWRGNLYTPGNGLIYRYSTQNGKWRDILATGLVAGWMGLATNRDTLYVAQTFGQVVAVNTRTAQSVFLADLSSLSTLGVYPFGMAVYAPHIDGDVDGDGDFDARDYRDFHSCLTGPALVDLSAICYGANLDGDGDVDLVDIAEFQRIGGHER